MRGLAGIAPGGAATFFVSPKKVAKERRAGARAACAVPCAARRWRDAQKLALRAQTSAHLYPPASALLSPAYGSGGGDGSLRCARDHGWRDLCDPAPSFRGQINPSRGRAKQSPVATTCRMPWRVAQWRADKEGRMSERSEFCAPPPRREQRSVPVASAKGQGIRLTFLLVPFLWRSKEKELARRGETRPGRFNPGGRESRPASASPSGQD